MPLNEQDARALTYLARRLRHETPGAGDWDEPGIYAVVSSLIGQHLGTSIERVTRHAGDPAAKTPGAIRRPFVPDPQRATPSGVRPAEACHNCGRTLTASCCDRPQARPTRTPPTPAWTQARAARRTT